MQGGKTLRTVLVSSTLLLTVISSVSFGIYAGYAAVSGILFAFGHRKQKKSAPVAASAPALVATADPN
jgi:hypothetical protein